MNINFHVNFLTVIVSSLKLKIEKLSQVRAKIHT